MVVKHVVQSEFSSRDVIGRSDPRRLPFMCLMAAQEGAFARPLFLA